MKSYAARRARLLAKMQAQGGAVAIIATAPEQVRNSDCDFPFRHDSNFFYLSGFPEPHSVMVLIAGADGKHESLLFCREKNVEREIWDGFRYGPDAARDHFGFDAAYPIDALDAEITRRAAKLPTIYYALGSRLEAQVSGWLHTMRTQSRSAPQTCIDIGLLLNDMRLFKDADEVATMSRAAQISADAHMRAMRTICPGMNEYQILAEIEYEFRKNGAQYPAYTPIVASGGNACILHYIANNAVCKDGDLLLIDAGCELDGYAADVTRTFPVNGRFSGPQRDCYELVLAAQQAALGKALAGLPYHAMNDAAVRILAQGMLDLGLLDGGKVGGVDDVIEKKAHRQFYMHGTGHWLGMDVHDVGDYKNGPAPGGGERAERLLEAGMVVTIEPGIYIRPSEGVPEAFWNIGIRIEDDILITPDGHLNMSEAAPRAIDEIEALMKE
jgi:Xaa-Pro aminopeptidase